MAKLCAILHKFEPGVHNLAAAFMAGKSSSQPTTARCPLPRAVVSFSSLPTR